MKVYKIKVNGKAYRVELEAIEETKSETPVAAKEEPKVEEKKPAAPQASSGEGREVLSPIQGNVVNVLVKPGDKVNKGTVLLIIEAMKLENEVVSPYEGEVAEVLVGKGQNVAAKERIVLIR